MATSAKRSRQARVLTMLDNQLKSGEKTQKKTRDVKIPLSDNDIKRIKKEMSTISSRL